MVVLLPVRPWAPMRLLSPRPEPGLQGERSSLQGRLSGRDGCLLQSRARGSAASPTANREALPQACKDAVLFSERWGQAKSLKVHLHSL